MAKPKQAVLLIHGIGEQRPMDTLRGFVETVWTSDGSIHKQHSIPGVWSKPDTISGNFELRRLTTSTDKNNVRTDFFEYYWQHLMHGNSIGHVLAWAKILLWRPPWRVPRRLLAAWCTLVCLSMLLAFLLILTLLPKEFVSQWTPGWMSKWVTGGAAAVLTAASGPTIRNIVGDAARYLNPAPGNIRRRQQIRAKGIEILTRLHEEEYDRIIVVGHSLGSVIGYDILTHAWATYNEDAQRQNYPVLDEIERSAAERQFPKYRDLQRELLRELQQSGHRWRVTDFLTLGSPLAHAEVLLAEDAQALRGKQDSREFPVCPPTLEKDKFSFPQGATRRELHFAAVFGPCRWTNLYFKSRFLLFGDFIGGPLQEQFGCGIDDRVVTTTLRSGIFSHTLYWTQGGDGDHIAVLRRALNLLDR